MTDEHRPLQCVWSEILQKYVFMAYPGHHTGTAVVLTDDNRPSLDDHLRTWDAVTFNIGAEWLCLACIKTTVGHFVLSFHPADDHLMLFTLGGYNSSCLDPDSKCLWSGTKREEWCANERWQLERIVTNILNELLEAENIPF